MALTVEIGSADLTEAVKRGSLKITRTNGDRKGRCDVTLVSTETIIDIGALGVGNTLEVFDGATMYFTGTTQSSRLRDISPGLYEATYTALDAGSVPTAAQAPFMLIDDRTAEAVYAAVMGDSGWLRHWRLGESSGTTAVDETGVQNGTYVNAPTLGVAGAFTTSSDTAVTFNGTDEYVTCGSAVLSGLADFTISLWFKGSSTNATQVLYCERAATATNALVRVYLDANGRPNFQYRDDAGTLDTVTPTSGDWTDGAWHHVVVTKEGTAIVIYVNGTSVRTGTLTANDTLTGTLLARLANDVFNAGQLFPGSLDEVALYEFALEPGQVRALYACRNMKRYTSLETEWTSDGAADVHIATVTTLESGLAAGQYLALESANLDGDAGFYGFLPSGQIQELGLAWLNPTTPVWTATIGDPPIHLAAAFP